MYAIKHSETVIKVEEICRQLGISAATFFNWKNKSSGAGVSVLKRLRQLEEENHQLKKLVADLSLDKQMLQDVIKKAVKPPYKKEMAIWLVENYRVPTRRACRCVGLSHSMYYYKPQRREETLLRMRMKEIAQTRVRYGFKRIFTLLRREGFTDNHKRACRIYKSEGLNLRTKRPRRNRSGAHRLERKENLSINKVWSMDFVQDALYNGEGFRVLTVVDNYTKICHGLLVGKSLKGIDVMNELSRISMVEQVHPERIQYDNGSEFISKEVDLWAYENKVTMDFSRPGKPTDNPYVESFNGKFRDECLSVNWFLSIADAEEKIEAFRWEYNHLRPHSSLNDLTPKEFINLHQTDPKTLLLTV